MKAYGQICKNKKYSIIKHVSVTSSLTSMEQIKTCSASSVHQKATCFQQSVTMLFLFILIAAAVAAEQCNLHQCSTPKHYAEIGCTPIHDEASCCPTRFDCSSLTGRDTNKCYYKGVAYDVNTELPPDPKNPCAAACRCISSGGKAETTCAHVECAELFTGPPSDPNCFHQYSLDKCCSINTYCHSNPAEKQQSVPLAECQYGGKTYKEGQKFYPEDAVSKQCVCQPGFNESIDGPWCKEISCGIELYNGRYVRDGCIPIYYGTSSSCPIDWRCPDSTDAVVSSGSVNNSVHKCKFGNLELNIQDKLSAISNKCVECSCSVPPFVTCIQKKYEECKN